VLRKGVKDFLSCAQWDTYQQKNIIWSLNQSKNLPLPFSISTQYLFMGEEVKGQQIAGFQIPKSFQIPGNFCDHPVDKCKEAAAKLESRSG